MISCAVPHPVSCVSTIHRSWLELNLCCLCLFKKLIFLKGTELLGVVWLPQLLECKPVTGGNGGINICCSLFAWGILRTWSMFSDLEQFLFECWLGHDLCAFT